MRGTRQPYEPVSTDDPGVGTRPVPGSTTGETEVVLNLRWSDGGTVTRPADGTWEYFRIDDEVILGQVQAGGTQLVSISRGLFGTAAVEHSADAEWKRVVAVCSPDPTGVPERRHAKFAAGDTPEDLILQAMISGHPNPHTYNTLGSWGRGIDPERIDIASFERIRDEVHKNEHLCGFVDEEMDAREFIVNQIAKPYGLVIVHGSDDRWRCLYLRNAPPQTATVTIDASVVKGQPKWSSGAGRVFAGYRLECDLRGGDGDPATILVNYFTDTKRIRGEAAKMQTHRSRFVNLTSGIRDPLGTYQGAQRVFDARRAYLFGRHAKPAPRITVPCLFSLYPVEKGDVVNVDLKNIPSTTGPGRDYVGLAQVVGKRPRLNDATVEFELEFLGGMLTRYGKLGPMLPISGLSGTTFTVSDTSDFDVGYGVRLVSPKWDTSVATTVTGKTATTLTVASVGTAVNGWSVMYGDWDAQTTAQKARGYVALADSSETLGAAQARAYRWTGA
jgi:hypothetical protein